MRAITQVVGGFDDGAVVVGAVVAGGVDGAVAAHGAVAGHNLALAGFDASAQLVSPTSFSSPSIQATVRARLDAAAPQPVGQAARKSAALQR